MKRQDLTGKTFGKWFVIEFSHVAPSGKQYWKCRCTCGKEAVREAYTITSGRSKSCRKCSAKDVGLKARLHGESYTRIYVLWQAMKTRCYNAKNKKAYKYHGALGVKVADEWLTDYIAFRDYMGPPPSPKHTIDRIDPYGDYKPGNVRWATQSEQMRNTRKNYKKWKGMVIHQ